MSALTEPHRLGTSATVEARRVAPEIASFKLPPRRELFFGGDWHSPKGGYSQILNPATQEDLGLAPNADATDVDAAVRAAEKGFASWRKTKPAERAMLLRRLSDRIRKAADEFGWLDALNTGNPVREMTKDAGAAAAQIDYFAGLVHETKGETLPVGDGALNYSVREPLGVVCRIVAYNHPLMFLAGKLAPVVASGNTVIMKPPAQAPLSSFRLAEIVSEIFPPGVINFVTGDTATGQALVSHPLVRKVAVIGSVPTGISVLHAAAEKLMPATLELGGKNPLIICPDADLDKAAHGAVSGMNFTWAGQSCGSTSRCFVHRSIYEPVLRKIAELVPKLHRCGLATDPATTMGCLISKAQFDKVVNYIALAHTDGARLVTGGDRPQDPALKNGWFIEPTVFADVTPRMRIFREEIFGPVLAVIPWDDEDDLFRDVNDLDLGLTASIWTRDLITAHRMAAKVESGFVWINHTSSHFLGAEFGGYKKSGLGREEGLSELLSYTQVKNVHVMLD